jgi:hypothetical protein
MVAPRPMPRPMPRRIIAGAAALALAASAGATTTFKIIGYEDLVDRLGAGNVPSGAGVIAAQIESLSGGAYGPNQALGEFGGISFFPMNGQPGTSGHATTVATNFYGNFGSVAPDVNTVYLYAVALTNGIDGWLLNTFLGVNSLIPLDPSPPATLPAPIKIMNHSWVGAFADPQQPGYNPLLDIMALRRADFSITRDDTLMLVGVNNDNPADPNDGANRPLLSHLYNGIAVGRRDGNHTIDATLTAIDGPGRMKPEIVAPGGATSFATPVVSAVAALLVETARSLPGVAGVSVADRSEVIKAVLLAGATHESFHGAAWTNNAPTSGPSRGATAQPIDPVVGAGTVNVNTSHMILTAPQFSGAQTPAAAPVIGPRGWDLATVSTSPVAARNRYWRLNVTAPINELTVVATWHRRFTVLYDGQFSSNCDLQLWRLGPKGQLITLIGDAGLPHFDGGNVASQSLVDNVELLRISGLQPGDYVLHLRRLDSFTGVPDWPVAVAWFADIPTPAIPADLNNDGLVNGLDLGILLINWSIPAGSPGCGGALPCPSDLNGDGQVNGLDLGILLGSWTI